MKKYFLLILSVIFYFTASSQVKHNKFATTITFAKNNPGFQFDGTTISEIKDQSGYFLSNRYDDQSGGFYPSIVKLDIDGKIVLDSIYNITPLNLNGSSEVIKSATSLTSHTVLYSTESMAQPSLIVSGPYLINTDLNGNLNWHVGLQDDTFDLESATVINTQDGGYAIVGTMEDPVLNSHKEAGMIIKLDGSGNYMWDNFYRSTDTLGFIFDNGIETPDGGILVVGEAPLFHENAKSYLLAAKMSSTGTVIWSKVLKLENPIDPTIAPDKVSVGMLNNTDAFISYEQHDTTGGSHKVPVLTSINVNTGVNNWTKVYSLPSEPELARAASDGKGNILLHAMDSIDQPVIYRFDDNGNYIGSKSFMTNSPVPYLHFPFETVPTQDGGFIHINGMYANEMLVVKTDKNLDPSCHAVDSLYPFTLTANLNIDTSVFGVLDSVYVLPNLTPITLTPTATPFGSDAADDSLICSCSNTITGTVLDGVTPVNGAKVFLFKKGIVPKPWAPLDSVVTGVSGTYMFNYVPTDSFMVKVDPSPIFNPNSLRSYHKHLDTCYRWEAAGVFHTHCDSGNVIKDVTLITPPPLTGNSSLNGYVYEYSGSFSKKQPGDPVPGIGITVEQSPGGVIGGSTSGGNGFYDLSNINSSATYIVTIDYPGLPHDSIWTVAVNFNDSILDSLNFYVDSTGIYILVEPLGVTVANEANLELELYPNPTNGPATLMINAIKPKDIYIDVTNEVGKIISTTNERVGSGVNKINLNTDNLSSGIYFIKVREKGKLYVRKLIKY